MILFLFAIYIAHIFFQMDYKYFRLLTCIFDPLFHAGLGTYISDRLKTVKFWYKHFRLPIYFLSRLLLYINSILDRLYKFWLDCLSCKSVV